MKTKAVDPAWFEIRNPQFSLKKIKALLFDLDETLYFIPSGAQFDQYGRSLAGFLPDEEQADFLRELEQAWHASSPMKVGRSYDPSTELILEFDDHWELKEGHRMSGRKIPAEELLKHYPAGIKESEIEGLIHLASGWGIPTMLAKRRGLGREHYRKAYLATRAAMKNNPDLYPLVAPREIVRFFERLSKEKYLLMVATNSDTEDALHILERLGIRSCFNEVYGEAKKPAKSVSLLKEIAVAAGLKFENLLATGDSVYNDLRDAKKLGAQTVLIERYAGQPLGYVDARVWDFEGFIRLWDSQI